MFWLEACWTLEGQRPSVRLVALWLGVFQSRHCEHLFKGCLAMGSATTCKQEATCEQRLATAAAAEAAAANLGSGLCMSSAKQIIAMSTWHGNCLSSQGCIADAVRTAPNTTRKQWRRCSALHTTSCTKRLLQWTWSLTGSARKTTASKGRISKTTQQGDGDGGGGSFLACVLPNLKHSRACNVHGCQATLSFREACGCRVFVARQAGSWFS